MCMCMHRIINNTLNMLSFRAGATNQNIDTTKRANYDQLKNEHKKTHTTLFVGIIVFCIFLNLFLIYTQSLKNAAAAVSGCRRHWFSNRIYIVWNCLKKHKMLYIVNQKHYKLIPVANRMQYPYA